MDAVLQSLRLAEGSVGRNQLLVVGEPLPISGEAGASFLRCSHGNSLSETPSFWHRLILLDSEREKRVNTLEAGCQAAAQSPEKSRGCILQAYAGVSIPR